MKMKTRLLLSILVLLAFSYARANNQPEQSYFKFTTSNGLIVSVYNEKTGGIDYVYPHIFTNTDSSHYVHPFIGNIKLKSAEKPIRTVYEQHTHVISAAFKDFTVYYTASFQQHDKVFYIVVRGPKNKIENLEFDAEMGAGKQVSGIDHLENSLQDLPCLIEGDAIAGTILKQYKGDIYEKYFLYSFTDALHKDRNIINKAIESIRSSPGSLIDTEVKYMRKLIDNCRYPPTLSAKERNTLEQSVSILKMSQVSEYEIFPNSPGQIMASLRPGLWHTAWVRDAAFAIQAMTRLGMYHEAGKGLEFMLKAPANKYKHYIYKDGKDYGPGMDYQISLTRYFGDGSEECDTNNDGPNIEYDDFGLFLIAYIDYVNRSADWAFYKQWNDIVAHKVADVIIHCMESNHLIKADSGPWEHHLALTKQYTFTSGVCARGLALFSEAQKRQGLPYQKYKEAADKIKQAILDHMLVDQKYLKGNAGDMNITDHEYWDGGSFELFANGLITDTNLFKSHMEAYDKRLRIKGARPGYIRLESGDPYENQEWLFINLRIAYAHVRSGNKKAAKPLIDYITEQAAANHNTIPEMISNKSQMEKVPAEKHDIEIWCNCIRDKGDMYIGMIPMVGYGSGAYTLALLSYYGLN
jgi:GH15 family glucan-1,4-alpha-glucosidase